jgi:hypothetical protein
VVLGGAPTVVIVQGQFAGAPTAVYGVGGNDLFYVALTSSTSYTNLTLDGGAGVSSLAVFDLSGGATLQDVVTVIGEGTVQAAYPGGAASAIHYQNFDHILGDLPEG